MDERSGTDAADAPVLVGLVGLEDPDARARATAAALLGAAPVRGAVRALRTLVLDDADAVVRCAALSSLVRITAPSSATRVLRTALEDPDPSVRRRACELAPHLGAHASRRLLRARLRDEPLVAEAAAFAIGEHPSAGRADVERLSDAAITHSEPLVREAAVAALGAIGHAHGKAAVLHACSDKPAIRRRAVLALAAFEGDDVEQALRAARDDRDWQVRDAAELMLRADEER